MTAADIASRWLGGPQTSEREQRAKLLAQRSKIAWRDVLEQMAPVDNRVHQPLSVSPRKLRPR